MRRCRRWKPPVCRGPGLRRAAEKGRWPQRLRLYACAPEGVDDDVGEADAELVVDHHHSPWAMRVLLTRTSMGSPGHGVEFDPPSRGRAAGGFDGDLGAPGVRR